MLYFYFHMQLVAGSQNGEVLSVRVWASFLSVCALFFLLFPAAMKTVCKVIVNHFWWHVA